MGRQQTRVDFARIVYDDDSLVPIPGADIELTPWKWDERIWGSRQYENCDLTIKPSSLELHGLPQTYYQKGVANQDACEVLGSSVVRMESVDLWSVDIRHGGWWKWNEPRNLFSNESVAGRAQVLSGLAPWDISYLDPAHKIKEAAPIKAIIWRRDSSGRPYVHTEFTKRASFTGKWVGGAQRDTRDPATNAIIWDNVDTVKNEFVLGTAVPDLPVIYFNRDAGWQIGLAPAGDPDILATDEYLGQSDGTNLQVFYTRYFPILDASYTVYGFAGGVITPLAEGADFAIDIDRGELTFPAGYTAPVSGSFIYIKYRPTIEVEYELESGTNFMTPDTIDLNPLNGATNQGFIYLTEKDLNVARLELTCDRPVIDLTNRLYGPVYVGADYSIVTATAYNRNDEPVPGVEVTIYLDLSAGGRINGRTTSVTIRTNEDGQANAVYVGPQTAERLTYYSEMDGNDIDFNGLDLSLSPTMRDIYTYAVYNDDTDWQPIVIDGGGKLCGGGRKVVVYENSVVYVHPSDGSSPAFGPVRPTNWFQKIGGDTLRYLVPLPPLDPAGTKLVGYAAILPIEAQLHASCYSVLYQTLLVSEDLKLKVDLPPYLKGSYLSAFLGAEVPYGFRLYDNKTTVASGLRGATFLTLNVSKRVGTFPLFYEGTYYYPGDNQSPQEKEPAGSEDYRWEGRAGYRFRVKV